MSPAFIYILEIFLVLLAIGAFLVIIFENDKPSRQFAWILIVFFIPVFGLILYALFGQNRRKRKIYSYDKVIKMQQVAKSNVDLETLNRVGLENRHLNLIKLLHRNAYAIPYVMNKIEVLGDGKTTFDAFIQALKEAKEHIHLEFYIIGDDNISNQIREILIQKAKEGVKVKIIYDYLGSFTLSKKYINSLRAAGVEMRSFLPLKFSFIRSHINNRNHRKMIIIDGKVGFIGGLNLADRYLHGNALGVWRDTFLRIEGAAVHGIQMQFLIDWGFVTGEAILDKQYYPESELFPTENLVQIVSSGPDSDNSAILQGIVAALTSARDYAYIHTPYFVPNETLYNTMKIVAMSGVDVRLMIPHKSDSPVVTASMASYLEEMMEAGVKVLRYSGGFLHSKSIVIDDMISIVGSSNLDERSFETNFEANAFVLCRETAKITRKLFEEDSEHCIMLDLERWQKRKLGHKFKERLARLFSPLM